MTSSGLFSKMPESLSRVQEHVIYRYFHTVFVFKAGDNNKYQEITELGRL